MVIHLLFWNPLWDSSSGGISSGNGIDSSSGVVVVVAHSSRKDDSITQMAFREHFHTWECFEPELRDS